MARREAGWTGELERGQPGSYYESRDAAEKGGNKKHTRRIEEGESHF